MTENLFLVPFDYPNFRRTVQTPQFESDDVPEDLPEEVKEMETPRIWGVRDGNRNESYFNRMNSGDSLLFYNDGTYRFAGRVGIKFESSLVTRNFWGHAPSTMLYSVDDFVPISLPRSRFNNFVGYSEQWYPQGLQRVSDEKMNNLRNHYGSVNALVGDFSTE